MSRQHPPTPLTSDGLDELSCSLKESGNISHNQSKSSTPLLLVSNATPLRKRAQSTQRPILLKTQYSLMKTDNFIPSTPSRRSLAFGTTSAFTEFKPLSQPSKSPVLLKKDDEILHVSQPIGSNKFVIQHQKQSCLNELHCIDDIQSSGEYGFNNYQTEYEGDVNDEGEDYDEECNENGNYSMVDNEDLDILISRNTYLLQQYLQRNRISVGFPFKGYKEALVLDIRNGDDNPREQIAEIVTITQRRKKDFIERHRQQEVDKEITQETTEMETPFSTDKGLLNFRPKSPGIMSFEKYKKPTPPLSDARKPKRKMSITITGFIDQKQFEKELNENEKQEFDTYRETLMELLYTEEVHVQSLHVLANVYLRPLANGKYGKLVRKINVQIDQLLKLHTLFYHKLTIRIEEAGDEIPIIADLLRYFFHFVKSTCGYIVDYNTNLKLANTLMTHASVQQILTESKQKYTEANPSITIQRIQSYLIMPIQRIPRYVLLIKMMICNAPPLSPDTDKLLECYQLILEVAAWINDKKLLEEEREKYNSILNVISGLYDLNKSCRRYIVSGGCEYLDITSKGGVSYAYFFLFNDVLIQTKIIKHHGHKVKSKQLSHIYQLLNDYTSFDNFDNDLFQVERVFMVTEDAVVSFTSNDLNRPSISFISPLSDLSITLTFKSPLDANAWFVALAYTIHLSPRVNDAKGLFNMRNG